MTYELFNFERSSTNRKISDYKKSKNGEKKRTQKLLLKYRYIVNVPIYILCYVPYERSFHFEPKV
jgi:hypothetical protein